MPAMRSTLPLRPGSTPADRSAPDPDPVPDPDPDPDPDPPACSFSFSICLRSCLANFFDCGAARPFGCTARYFS